MRFAVGLVCVAACAAQPVPPPANVRSRAVQPTVTKREVPPKRVAAALTPDVVLATIRGRYISGVERCYRRHLKKDGGARGVVLVSFTVDKAGRAREGEAHGVTDTVDDCIVAQISRWHFPVSQRHTEARFALGLELTN